MSWAQRAAVAPPAPVRPAVPLGAPAREAAEHEQPAISTPSATSSSAIVAAIEEPLYLINELFIAGRLEIIKPADIDKMVVYKSSNSPALWRSLAANGIVSVTLKSKFRPPAKTLDGIKQELKLAGPVRYKVNGLLLEDASLRILTRDIAGLDVTRDVPDSTSTVVNIRLLRTAPKRSQNPPGTIQIRGTAAR
jgi:hypothetical protein